jgi:YkoY family integral membrane protein
MFGQTFQTADLASVLALVLLEGLLSADNALVLAIMVRHLPKDQQRKALLYGLGGAFVFRLIAILFASIVLKQWWLQAIGGGYLLYLPIKHFITHGQGEHHDAKKVKGGFWKTVIAVELTDIAFALDSVLAGIGFITRPGVGVQTDKIWVVYVGALIGIVLLRFAASVFVRILERFPALDHVAYLLVGWVGVKLATHAAHKAKEVGVIGFDVPAMSQAFFWIGLVAILVVGTLFAVRHRREAPPEDEAALVEETEKLQIPENEGPRKTKS